MKLLLTHESVDPSAVNNEAIRWASFNGHLEVVKLLLAHELVDPSDAIDLAIINNHTEIEKLLRESVSK